MPPMPNVYDHQARGVESTQVKRRRPRALVHRVVRSGLSHPGLYQTPCGGVKSSDSDRCGWNGRVGTQRRKGRKPKASYKSSDRMRTQIGSCERPMLCNPESSRDCAKNRRADHRSSCSDGISSAANHSNMAIFFASLRLCVRRRIGPNVSDQRLATARLATPSDSIASPLHRVVMR